MTFVHQHLYQTMIMAFTGVISHHQDVIGDDVGALIYGFKNLSPYRIGKSAATHTIRMEALRNSTVPMVYQK